MVNPDAHWVTAPPAPNDCSLIRDFRAECSLANSLTSDDVPQEFGAGLDSQRGSELAAAEREIGTRILHLVGICKAGPSAAVDGEMKAYGVERLRASAASIMPRRIDVLTLVIAE